MELALLVDFGSTFTKVMAVDLGMDEVIGTAKSYTTVETDIMEGFLFALNELERSTGLRNPPYKYKLACSSAAGGLKMVAVGLIPDLTAEAAKRAALGAGAKIIDVFAHELTKNEIIKIEEYVPDIILLAGGTDGGNKNTIIHNARMIAQSKEIKAPVVVSGNKSVSDEICIILQEGKKDYYITENVMPEINVLNIDPARKTIREIFLRKIVEAKGLKRAEKYIDRILMPTPAAVLKAAEFLSKGYETEEGLGELLVVDVGGATTDVYSVANGEPSKSGIILKGLPEPYAKRTVEGDLGMRYSAVALLESAGMARIIGDKNISSEIMEGHIKKVRYNPEFVSKDDLSSRLDNMLGYTAVELAVERHCGNLEVIYTPFGASYVQNGKDLTGVKYIVGTGGIIVFNEKPDEILRGALFDQTRPFILKPIEPKMLTDKKYIMAGMGLLAEVRPASAVRIMKKYTVQT